MLGAKAKLQQSVQTVMAALLCILIGLVVGLVALFIINPEHAIDQGFMRIIQGGFYDFPYGVGRTLVNAAPLIMTGLSYHNPTYIFVRSNCIPHMHS